MHKSFDLYEISTQLKQINQKMIEQISLSDSIIKVINEFANDATLQSDSFNNLKKRMYLVHASIWKTIRLCSQSIINANDLLLTSYMNTAGYDFIDTEILINTIEAFELHIKYLITIECLSNETAPLIYVLRATVNKIHEKIESLNSFDTQTAYLYEEANQYLHHLNYVLRELQTDDWDILTGTFKSDISTDWVSNINMINFNSVFNCIVNKDILIRDDISQLIELAIQNPRQEVPKSLFDKTYDFIIRFLGELKIAVRLEWLSRGMQSTGAAAYDLGFWLTNITGIRGTGFVIVNPNYTSSIKFLQRSGVVLTYAGKYGVPFIGTAIDFGVQIWNGDTPKDAFVKASAHLTIGIAGAKLGAVVGVQLGGALGTLFGPAGTTVGVVAGAILGFAIGFLGANIFDEIYDSNNGLLGTISPVGASVGASIGLISFVSALTLNLNEEW